MNHHFVFINISQSECTLACSTSYDLKCNKPISAVVLLALITFAQQARWNSNIFRALCFILNCSSVISLESPRCISLMVSLGFPAIFFSIYLYINLYCIISRWRTIKKTNTKMLSRIKFCPTASFDSASKLKKQSLRSCCCLRSCTSQFLYYTLGIFVITQP